MGVIVFAIAELVYLFTLEPTTSFWDCSEFITCANKLEVGHAPGAPLFMLLGRFFSLFAGGNVTKVAVMINALSATASALTIMFLFYILIWFSEKLVFKSFNSIEDRTKQLLIYGASFIGAITYAFTDSFWFSAVEGEVYATSSLFSAIVFWCILKWESTTGEEWEETRWIYLIFFILGLSVGIHLLNMLALPAIVLVFYSKKYKISTKGIIYSQLISLVLLLVFIFGIIPGVAKYAALTDLIFVNKIGLPVYSGAIFFIVILSIALRYSYRFFKKKGKKIASIAVVALSLWLAGYSSFAVLVIRSNSNPFIDINNVENLFGLVDYLNREQYPMRPLLKGNSFNSPIIDYNKRYTYKLYNGKYHKDELNPEYVFDKNTLSVFPRMASLDPGHDKFYKKWVDIKGRKVKIRNNKGETETIVVPTFFDNIRFFLKYQVGHMYLRYFMWNFVGKQNDIQGHGGHLRGNWISGIPIVDSFRLGDQEKLPDKYKNHKARNRYYFLPLLLGIVGMVYHFKRDRLNFGVVFLLFVLTGLAIVVYLNEIPITPRERDYAFVCSFFAFCIWIGMGVIAIYEYVLKLTKRRIALGSLLVILLLIVPANMLKENWDDHNRSGRSVAHDMAWNTLNIMDSDAIFFTNGDNDTYPIWYMQEVEGVRQDVHHILQTFLPIDWYANQLQYSHKNKKPVPISYSGTELLMSKNNYFPVIRKFDSCFNVEEVVDFLQSQDKRSKVKLANGSLVDFIPSDRLYLKVNKENFINSCSCAKDYKGSIPQTINFRIDKKYLSREDVLLLDILSKNNWKRPIYFMSPASLNDLGLSAYLHREGNIYRLMPFKTILPDEIDYNQALKQYKMISEEFKWGNIPDNKVFLDYTTLNIIQTFRYHLMFAEVAEQLLKYSEEEKAVEILNIGTRMLPAERVGYSGFSPEIVKTYYRLEEKTSADLLAEEILKFYIELFDNYSSVHSENVSVQTDGEIDLGMYIVGEILKISSKYSPDLVHKYNEQIQGYYSEFYASRYYID